MTRHGFNRRLFAGAIGAGVFCAGRALAVGGIQVMTASRIAPPEDQAYYPPTSLATVADIYKRMTATVSVNSAGPFAFVVDTGANQSVISLELAQQLNLTKGVPEAVNGVAGVQNAPTTEATLSLGGRALPKATLSILPSAAIGGDGILGLDSLDGDRLTLDFKLQNLRIESAGRPSHDPRDFAMKAHRRNGQLTLVDADLAGIPLVAFLDSGAQNTIGNMALRSAAITRHPSTPWADTHVVSATGQVIAAEMADLPALRVGGMRLPNWPVAFADLHTFQMWNLIEKPAILLGVDVLSRFEVVCLDFARDEVRFRLPATIW